MDISEAGPRGLRAALFSALVVLLSAGSHVLMSRVPLPPALVAGAFTAVFGLAFVLAGRERGFGAIAGLLVPLELAADTAFTAAQHFCYGPAGGPVDGPLRALGLAELCGGTPVGGPLTEVTGAAPDPALLLASPAPWTPWLLLGAHVSVGLLAALWLRRGERALGRLLRVVAVRAFRPLLLAVASGGAAPPSARPAPRTARPGAGARTRFPVHSVGRRGPPRPAPLFGV
ncbi:hypothetical protein ABT084_06920 [Streptomyces sp. NPDC002138]|uniref:hypothetical protein n=1 Tax=Streptomyces sp. NPDC002138 TaxID=3154410 RepID=UPI0033293D3F